MPSRAEAEHRSVGDDAAMMGRALDLAREGLGRVWPNPSVGCVIVKDGRILAEARTADGGRPHAEARALAMAGAAARGATAYVTLEPCSHLGATPPCADALAAAGIARVVVATADPDPRVDGRGLARLRAAGIRVELGLRDAEARRVNEGFFMRICTGRPHVTLKLASSLDGRIATATGESRWITGPEARAEVHRLRAASDAVMVGTGTARADDPMLTVRLGQGTDRRQPVRVLIDPRLDLPVDMAAIRSAAEVPTWLVATPAADPVRRREREAAGCLVVEAETDAAGALDLPSVLRALAARGLTRLLVEGGARLATNLLREGLVDRLLWFRAPMLIGGDGLAAIGPLGIGRLGEARRFVRTGMRTFGEDSLESWEPAH